MNLYGSLDGKPNRGPGGIPSLEEEFGGGDTYSEAGGDFLVLEILEQVIMLKVILMLVLIDKENLEHNN